MANFKTIINEIKNFCDNHYQINGFGWGPLSNISTKNQNFVMVWLLPTSAKKDISSTYISYDMYVFDVLKQDDSNKLDVMSDTFEIGTDIISEFFDKEEEYEFVMNEKADAEPFDFNFDDLCGGWIFKIEIEYENSLNTCNIPAQSNWTYEGILTVEKDRWYLGYEEAKFGEINPIHSNIEYFYYHTGKTRLFIKIKTYTDELIVEIDGVDIPFERTKIGDFYSDNMTNPFVIGQEYQIKLKY